LGKGGLCAPPPPPPNKISCNSLRYPPPPLAEPLQHLILISNRYALVGITIVSFLNPWASAGPHKNPSNLYVDDITICTRVHRHRDISLQISSLVHLVAGRCNGPVPGGTTVRLLPNHQLAARPASTTSPIRVIEAGFHNNLLFWPPCSRITGLCQ
jgi:hypothetical protein